MNRRSFFRKLGLTTGVAIAAPVAIPKLLEAVPKSEVWRYSMDGIFAQAHELWLSRPPSRYIDVYTDRETADQIKKGVARYEWKEKYRQERIARSANNRREEWVQVPYSSATLLV